VCSEKCFTLMVSVGKGIHPPKTSLPEGPRWKTRVNKYTNEAEINKPDKQKLKKFLYHYFKNFKTNNNTYICKKTMFGMRQYDMCILGNVEVCPTQTQHTVCVCS